MACGSEAPQSRSRLEAPDAAAADAISLPGETGGPAESSTDGAPGAPADAGAAELPCTAQIEPVDVELDVGDPAIFVEQNGAIHLAYGVRAAGRWGLAYARNNGGVWKRELAVPFEGHTEAAGLAVDASGAVHVAYSSIAESGDDRNRAVYYAHRTLAGVWTSQRVLADTLRVELSDHFIRRFGAVIGGRVEFA